MEKSDHDLIFAEIELLRALAEGRPKLCRVSGQQRVKEASEWRNMLYIGASYVEDKMPTHVRTIAEIKIK